MSTATLPDAVQAIKQIVGPTGWLDGSDMNGYAADWRQAYRVGPLLVVRPRTSDEISEVIKVCAQTGISIVSQGGNTGLSGGAVAYEDRPSIILSTTRMQSIIAVDPDCFTITAEAGVTIEALQDAALAVDRELGVDWGARGSATVGGAVSTDAGGINVLRSGTMRDQVLGLEVVLGDGRVWDGLRALRKDASGYGLKHVFIGAEGTLGVVTKVVLKLEPRRSERQSFFGVVSDFERLPELYSLAKETGQQSLAAFELIPERGVARVCERFGSVTRPIDTHADWYVLGQLASNRPVDDLITDFLSEAVDRGLLSDAVVAQGAAQEENLWTLRDELPPEPLFGIKGAKFDAVVPIDRVAAYHNEVVMLASRLDSSLVVYAFGHLGDGNLHLYVLVDPELNHSMSPALKQTVEDQVDELTWRFGGSISAEHGVGQDLSDRMGGQKSDVELDLLASIKRAIDPGDLFNPGRGSHGTRFR